MSQPSGARRLMHIQHKHHGVCVRAGQPCGGGTQG